MTAKVVGLPVFDLTKVMERVAREHKDWTAADLAKAERLYRQFLWLAKTTKRNALMPPHEADEVWHAHLLHTQQYKAAVCWFS